MSSDTAEGLISALIENMKGASDDWKSFSMVISFAGGHFSGTSGYAYSPDGGISAVASRPSGVKDAVDAYMQSYFKSGEPLPQKILVQFDRDLGQYEVTFEDKDPSRWKVTPANIDAIREELRPSFEG